MEQQNNIVSSSSPATEYLSSSQPHPHQQQRQLGPRDPSTSLPAPEAAAATSSAEPLSVSEPSLRFPRPVGSSHLANWVSTSNPDIMPITSNPTEDTTLADSTYELISGAATDDSESWSQDGNDNECISESFSSLDPRRSDEVQSIAGTEQMSDDEYATMPPETFSHHAPAAAEEPSPEEAHRYVDNDSEHESEDDASSRSSLEYTQQSLGTPSLVTPEASKIYEKPIQGPDDRQATMRTAVEWSRNFIDQTWNRAREYKKFVQRGLADGTIHPTHPALLVIAALQLLFFAYMTHLAVMYMGRAVPATPGAPAMTAVTTSEAVAPHLLTSTQSASPYRPLATAYGSTSLIVKEDESFSQWFKKKPEVSFVAYARPSYSAILAQVEGDEVAANWVSNNCVTFEAVKDGRVVDAVVVATDLGLLLKFARRDTHGLVDVVLEVTCKPSFKKVVQIHFENTALEKVLDFTKNLTRDLKPVAGHVDDFLKTAVVPTVASLSSSMRSVYEHPQVQTIKADIAAFSARSFDELHTGFQKRLDRLGNMTRAKKQALGVVRNVQTRLQLGLINAQVSARISWLSMLGRTRESDEYRRKAAAFLEEKLAAAKKAVAAAAENGAASTPRRIWWEHLDPRHQAGEIFAWE